MNSESGEPQPTSTVNPQWLIAFPLSCENKKLSQQSFACDENEIMRNTLTAAVSRTNANRYTRERESNNLPARRRHVCIISTANWLQFHRIDFWRAFSTCWFFTKLSHRYTCACWAWSLFDCCTASKLSAPIPFGHLSNQYDISSGYHVVENIIYKLKMLERWAYASCVATILHSFKEKIVCCNFCRQKIFAKLAMLGNYVLPLY